MFVVFRFFPSLILPLPLPHIVLLQLLIIVVAFKSLHSNFCFKLKVVILAGADSNWILTPLPFYCITSAHRFAIVVDWSGLAVIVVVVVAVVVCCSAFGFEFRFRD